MIYSDDINKSTLILSCFVLVLSLVVLVLPCFVLVLSGVLLVLSRVVSCCVVLSRVVTGAVF